MNDPRMDAALDSYPLTPLPPDFIKRTMGRVKAAPRFRLHFVDLALPVFFSLFTLLVAVFVLWGFSTIDPLWVEQVKLTLKFIQLNTSPIFLWVGAGFSILGVMVTGLLAFSLLLLSYRPRSVSRVRI
jgi:hypothetical protein